MGIVELHAEVKCRVNKKLEKTTVGRVLMYDIVPKQVPFTAVNKVMGKKELAALIDRCYRLCGQKETVLLADHLRTLGYTEATRAGISIAMVNMEIPEAKKGILKRCQEQVEEITNQYVEGLITNGERYNKVIDIWSKAAEEISTEMMKNISTVEFHAPSGDAKDKKIGPSFNPIFIMADSGARGSV
jgi:DNA-directed RNA polymerase subunit beta'